MATVKSFKYANTSILLGDGGTPTETFTALCGFEEMSMTLNVESNTEAIWDCLDPDGMAWGVTNIDSQQITLAGNGLLDTDAMKLWQAWWYTDAGKEKNIRWYRNLTLANGGGWFQGPAILTSYEETGQRQRNWRAAIGISFNGQPAFVAAA